MTDCEHCERPLVSGATGTMHVWCWRHVRWGEPLADMVACGPQCSHLPGALHGIYLYTAGTRTVMARVLGYYPAGSQEATIRTPWDSDQ